MIINVTGQTIFLFLFALALAVLEVQIEGGSGWAANLPTWKPLKSRWYSRFYGWVMSGKELTGYHLAIVSLVFVAIHYPYFSGVGWSLASELTTISLFLLLTIFWDFFWFVVNPHYSFGKFWSEKVPWHKKWFCHLPIEYWSGLAVSFLLYTRFFTDIGLSGEWLEILCSLVLLTVAVIIFSVGVGIFNEKSDAQGN